MIKCIMALGPGELPSAGDFMRPPACSLARYTDSCSAAEPPTSKAGASVGGWCQKYGNIASADNFRREEVNNPDEDCEEGRHTGLGGTLPHHKTFSLLYGKRTCGLLLSTCSWEMENAEDCAVCRLRALKPCLAGNVQGKRRSEEKYPHC